MKAAFISVPALFGAAALSQEVKSGGGLDKNVINEHVKRAMPAIEECTKKEKKPVRGRLSVKFSISGEGKVTKSEVEESSVKNSAFETCLAGAIKTVQFPESVGHGTVEVRYPFAFTTEADTSEIVKKRKK